MSRANQVAVVWLSMASAAYAPLAAQTAGMPLEPLLRFGCDHCDGPLLFTRIAQLAWLPDGRILALDGAAPFVRIFTADGRAVHAFGREGSGPGELRTPFAAGLLPDGSIEVLDVRLLRIARFDARGGLLATRPIPRATFPLVAVRAEDAPAWIMSTTDWRAPTPTLVRLHDDAEASEALVSLPPDFPRTREGGPSLFAALAVSKDGTMAVGDGVFAYRILRFDADGRPLSPITRALERPRRTPAELKREQARLDREAARIQARRQVEGGGPGPPPRISAERNHWDAGALAYDADGRLWVRTTRGGEETTIFDVFSADGVLAGEVVFAGRLRTYALGRGGLIAEVLDPDDVARVGLWPVNDVIRE